MCGGEINKDLFKTFSVEGWSIEGHVTKVDKQILMDVGFADSKGINSIVRI